MLIISRDAGNSQLNIFYTWFFKLLRKTRQREISPTFLRGLNPSYDRYEVLNHTCEWNRIGIVIQHTFPNIYFSKSKCESTGKIDRSLFENIKIQMWNRWYEHKTSRSFTFDVSRFNKSFCLLFRHVLSFTGSKEKWSSIPHLFGIIYQIDNYICE